MTVINLTDVTANRNISLYGTNGIQGGGSSMITIGGKIPAMETPEPYKPQIKQDSSVDVSNVIGTGINDMSSYFNKAKKTKIKLKI